MESSSSESGTARAGSPGSDGAASTVMVRAPVPSTGLRGYRLFEPGPPSEDGTRESIAAGVALVRGSRERLDLTLEEMRWLCLVLQAEFPDLHPDAVLRGAVADLLEGGVELEDRPPHVVVRVDREDLDAVRAALDLGPRPGAAS